MDRKVYIASFGSGTEMGTRTNDESVIRRIRIGFSELYSCDVNFDST